MEVGREHFDSAVRGAAANLGDALSEMARAFVRQVVACDGGDDDVPQSQALDGLGEALRLVRGDRIGPSCVDGTEMAPAGATIAEYHEGGMAMRPALAQGWAASLFADGGDAAGLDDLSRLEEDIAGGELALEPRRQSALFAVSC